MAAGKMILPFVLQAAEIMKEAVGILEPLLAGEDKAQRGKIVLATVYGDVHDIGKNLVGSIMGNQGFEVIDLGKQVPNEDVVAAVLREKPAAVGLSALLVTTSREMGVVARMLEDEGQTIPLLVGGAAVNKAFAERMGDLGDGKRYAGGVHYAKDAFHAVRVLDGIRDGDGDAQAAEGVADGSTVPKVTRTPAEPAKPVVYGDPVEPPFYGTGQMLTWEADTLLDSIKRDSLYKGYWRGGTLTGEKYANAAREEFDPAFERVRKEIVDGELLDARGYYSFFPAITEDDRVILLDPGDFHTELAAWTFPRMERRGGRSLADWIRPEGDILSVQIVTIGWGLGKRVSELFEKEDHYSLGFYLNGLGNHLTEDITDRLTRETRRALALEGESGCRYGFGYPGLPGLEEHQRLMEIIAGEERMGISLTSGFQMVPEHSTLTVFVHHPEARYL
jgi:5-methyltetrahydrofolate--homocysteine methyltransferase